MTHHEHRTLTREDVVKIVGYIQAIDPQHDGHRPTLELWERGLQGYDPDDIREAVLEFHDDQPKAYSGQRIRITPADVRRIIHRHKHAQEAREAARTALEARKQPRTRATLPAGGWRELIKHIGTGGKQ